VKEANQRSEAELDEAKHRQEFSQSADETAAAI
jgi:hypothetical protein